MGGRKDLDSLRLSQRSNGLAFSQHHFLSASSVSASPGRPPKRLHSSILLQIDGNTPARPRDKMVSSLMPVEEHGKGDMVVPKQAIRSLIPPMPVPPKSKTDRRRNSVTSLKSITSSMLSRKRKFRPTPTLTTMPAEILDQMFKELFQKDLHALMLANSNLSEVAASYMYIEPYFASTYRFAQFTHTVIHCKHYADMVRVLDLGHFGKEGEDGREMKASAGWREFKYREHDMYHVNRDRLAEKGPNGLLTLPNSSHPPPSPFLMNFHFCRDVPIGGICHVLAACKRIRKVNVSRLQIAGDFIVKHPDHPPTAHTNLIYVSDVPKSWTWDGDQLTPIYTIEIIDWLRKLPLLDTFYAKKFLWLTTTMINDLMIDNWKLEKVDFRESGMLKDMTWQIKGSRMEVERIVREMEVAKDS